MVKALPSPEVVRCYFDDNFQPQLPAMCLRWQPDDLAGSERLWELPGNVCLVGPAPQRFGVSIERRGSDVYAVRLLWDHTCLSWTALTRAEVLCTSLAPLLATLGTDLWCLLEQPINPRERHLQPAA
jgi:hypothetical protein